MRGQSALEFMSTYGWAFMIILVMIGALSYFGVTNSDMFIPESCSVSGEFICEDFRLMNTQLSGTGSEVLAQITNNVGLPVTVYKPRVFYNGVDMTDDWCGEYFDSSGTRYIGSSLSLDVPAGDWVELSCNFGPTDKFEFPVGEKAIVTFEFEYIKIVGGFNHTAKGEIIAVAQEG